MSAIRVPAVETGERLGQPVGLPARPFHEALHLAFSEIRCGRAVEATSEADGTGDSDAHSCHVDDDAGPVEHRDPTSLEDRADLVALVAVQIVVAEHGDRRQRYMAELVDDHPDLVDRPATREIPGQQEQVGLYRRRGEGRPDDTAHVGADVDVADGGDGDAHRGAEVAPDSCGERPDPVVPVICS